MRILVKGRKFTTEQIWFEQFNAAKEIKIKAERVQVNANNVALTKGSKLQYSLISDLSGNLEDIFNAFTPTVRNEIRRAEREGIVCEQYESQDLVDHQELIDHFSKMYSGMYRQKGINAVLPLNAIEAYIRDRCFSLTVAKLNDEVCVYHSYIRGESISRLLHSCSEFRAEDNTKRNAIGRANKLLHYNDMLYLKNKGIIRYDWGGIASFEQPNGIDKFKMSFGGSPIQYYNCTIEKSLRAKLYALYRKILKK